MQPISFLPKDEITPAIQNLGETLSQINQSKIARKQEQIKSFEGLIDVSLQGIKNGHYEEAMGDLSSMTDRAKQIYMQAENENRPVNYKESLELSNQKKDLLYKVNTSKMLMDDYTKAMIDAAKLDKDHKLDPRTPKALNDWLNSKEPINSKAFPSSLVSSIYTTAELGRLQKEFAGGVKVSETNVKRKDGGTDVLKHSDPEAIKTQVALLWSDPTYKRTQELKGVTQEQDEKAQIEKFEGDTQQIKQRSGFGQAPLERQTTWFQQPDGTRIGYPLDKAERSVLVNGKNEDIKMLQAIENPKTGETVYDVEVKVKKKKPKSKEFETVWEKRQFTNKDSDAFGTFFEDVEKNRGAKVIKPTGTTKGTSASPAKTWRPK